MQKTTIRLGYCPTRRDVFSREEAMRYGRLVKETLAGHPGRNLQDFQPGHRLHHAGHPQEFINPRMKLPTVCPGVGQISEGDVMPAQHLASGEQAALGIPAAQAFRVRRVIPRPPQQHR